MKSPNPVINGQRRCTKCRIMQPVENYSKHPTPKSGLQAQCKLCVSKYLKEYHAKHGHKKMSDERKKIYNATRQKKYPERHQAVSAVNQAVKRGKFKKLACSVCGEVKTDFHHTNGYDKPNHFVGEWLCRKHHIETHVELRRQRLLSNIKGAL